MLLSLLGRCGFGRRICTVVEIAPDPGDASRVCWRVGEVGGASAPAGQATSFAVCGVSPQLDRIWSLVWEGDLPIGHRSTTSAMTALGLPNKAEHSKRGPGSRPGRTRGGIVIVLGIVLLIAAYLLAIPILWTLGIILIVVGVILELLGAIGYAVGGRRHYY
jgi:hypothetical protein